MTVLSSANGGGKASLAAVADWLVIAIAISLPWSTSATAILAVSGADAGIVIQEPFHQRTFLAALETALNRESSEHWSKSGIDGKQKSLYEGKTRATELIIAKGLQATGSKKPSI